MDLEMVSLKVIGKSKKTRKAGTILKTKMGGIAEPDIKFYFKTKVITTLAFEQKGQISQFNRMESPEKVHTCRETWLMSEAALQITGLGKQMMVTG